MTGLSLGDHCLPRVSVVIPTLNEAEQIGCCVRHMLEQAVAEVIVADGGSGDDTCRRAREAGAIVVAGPPGRAAQLNRGAAAASGSVLLFLHADCRLPGGVPQLLQCVVAGGRAGSFRHRIDAPDWRFRLIEWGDLLRQRWLGRPYGDQGIFVTRELFERLAGFPEVQLMEDVLFVRKLRRHARLACLPGPLQTSARRWLSRGIFRQLALNHYLRLAHRLGVPLDRLAKLYYG